jgi:hypothetical protein
MRALYQLQIAIAEHLKGNPDDLGALVMACTSGVQAAVSKANERANAQGNIANCALILLDGKRMSAKTRDMLYANMQRSIGDGDTTAIQDKFKGVSA